jgi:WD40 repeat protein
LRKGEEIITLTGQTGHVTSIGFSADGRTVAAGADDGVARLWDVQAGHPRAILAGHTGPLTSIAFSPDGRTIATASRDGTVRVWETGPHNAEEAIATICTTVERGMTRDERLAYLRLAETINTC